MRDAAAEVGICIRSTTALRGPGLSVRCHLTSEPFFPPPLPLHLCVFSDVVGVRRPRLLELRVQQGGVAADVYVRT